MTDDRVKTARTLLVADHLWEAFSIMAVEMGSDREALINQALYTFARLNGYFFPGDLKRLSGQLPPVPASAVSQPIESSHPRLQPGPPTMVRSSSATPPSLPFVQPPPFAVPPPIAPPSPARSGPSLVEVDDSLLGEEAQVATSMELPDIAASLGGLRQPGLARDFVVKSAPPAAAEGPAANAAPGSPALVLLAEGRELDRIIKDRFLIGRGKHCDLVINSGKVSREHAAITREGPAYFIEDLGSSNGTWFDKRRISRRQIQDGDEYFICSEKLRCAFR
jgi:FHA domain